MTDDHSPGRVSPVAYFYLFCAVVGAVGCWTFNVLAFRQLGRAFTPGEFLAAGFQVSPLHSSIATDFWVGSAASLIWMIVEARRRRMPHLWLYVVLTFAVAWSCALPLFLFARERDLVRARGGGPAGSAGSTGWAPRAPAR
jgi:hypothetical protein